MKSNSNLIELNNIKKTYKINNEEYSVLEDLNLSISNGEFIMIMGKSGSGKTTLLNILGFLSKFDDGQYTFKDEDVSILNEASRSKFRNENIGFVFQQFNLINTLNVYQNVELPLIYRGGLSKAERESIVKEKLEIVGLSEKINQKPSQLSGGQQQRVAIARALVNDADIIFADEPTGSLDTETCKEIMDLLKELNNNGKTILMVTHDVDLTSYATRVIDLNDGIFNKKTKVEADKNNEDLVDTILEDSNDNHEALEHSEVLNEETNNGFDNIDDIIESVDVLDNEKELSDDTVNECVIKSTTNIKDNFFKKILNKITSRKRMVVQNNDVAN